MNVLCWNYPIYKPLTSPFHLWTFSYIERWKVFASPSSHAIPWEEPPNPQTHQSEFEQKHPGKHSSKHIKIIPITYGLCRMI